MSLQGWRHASVRVLAEKVGPVADLLVDDILSELGVTEQELTASHFVKFIRLVYEKLPATIDRRAACHDLQVAVLQIYGFNNKT